MIIGMRLSGVDGHGEICPNKYWYLDFGSNTRSVQWETGKALLKIACTTNVIVCRVCEGGDL